MTLATSAAHVARAAIEAVGYQTHDLLAAMADDGAGSPATLRVDGGMTANDWLCGFLADLNGVAVERPAMRECTALGAAFLAGLGVGLWPDLDALRAARPGVQLFAPTHGFDAPPLLDGWRHALRQALLA
jgi:glycerol kinase